MVRKLILLLSLVAACDGKPSDNGDSGPGGDGAAGWCGVRAVLDAECVACHGDTEPGGGLDLSQNAWEHLVNQPSELGSGMLLVVPGDVENSWLHVKMAGTQGLVGGDAMPPPDGASAESLAIVDEWIASGAPADCDEPGDSGTPTDAYHPTGFEAPDVHGLALKLAEENCTTCHGADFSGGSSGVSCDSCHTAGWREDCTYCHGGGDNTTGAPPRGIDGSPDDLAFGAHTAHVTGTIHAPFTCAQCHATPTDVTTPGHVLDGTAAIAETDFSGGISPAASWDGASCSNAYCHGDGRAPGSMTVGDEAPCGSCHAVASSGDVGSMSGEHGRHIGKGYGCEECHATVSAGGDAFADVTQHVDGDVDLSFPSGIQWDAGSCTGTCHGEGHSGRGW